MPQLDDPITAAVNTMLSCPLQIHLTGAGLQPFRGKEIIYPYACMAKDQRDFHFSLLGYDDASVTWNRWVRHILILHSVFIVTFVTFSSII